jgi:CheY-like chemotaxis protein
MSDVQPRILVVDDEENVTALVPELAVTLTAPADETFAEVLKNADDYDLILIDQQLNLSPDLTLSAIDGSSLVRHFRSWARQKSTALPPVVLITSNVEAFSGELPAVGPQIRLEGSFEGREHRFAPTLDVEWMLAKTDDMFQVKVLDLAQSGKRAKDLRLGEATALVGLRAFLGMQVPEAHASVLPPWADQIDEALRKSRAPIVPVPRIASPLQFGHGSDTVLRWLLHRCLPFPGLFFSDRYVAWDLRITPERFSELADSESDRQMPLLTRCRYEGACATLLPRRWWGSGIDRAAWVLHERASLSGSLQSALDELFKDAHLTALGLKSPVVAFNADLQENSLIEAESAVILSPPGWPVEALEPWASREEALKDPVLASMAPDLSAPIETLDK